MNAFDDQPQPATLPELEQLLFRAARRRAAPRFGRRRWVLAIAGTSLLLAAVAAAATGVFEIAGGKTSSGSFSIESRVVVPATGDERRGSICLQLRFNGGVPSYGCGGRPSAAKPFGLVIADPLDSGRERVVYGLVSSDVSRVIVLGGDGSHTEAVTGKEVGLPGRFFSVVAPNGGRLELVGYSAGGEELARLGSLTPPTDPPLSRAEAMAHGDPAGFAPAIAPPGSYEYQGKSITPAKAARLELVCMQEPGVMRCYDSESEAEAATRP